MPRFAAFIGRSWPGTTSCSDVYWSQPLVDGRDEDSGFEANRDFVVAGDHGSVALEAVVSAPGRVTLAVVDGVELRWSAAMRASLLAVACLVGLVGVGPRVFAPRRCRCRRRARVARRPPLAANTGSEPIIRYLIRISVDRYPGEPERSTGLGEVDGAVMPFDNEQGRFPLCPGESVWIECAYSMGDEKWGCRFQRAVRTPNRHCRRYRPWGAGVDVLQK